ncbi:uro-adherence factor A-like [Cololabis saira]|uniref:uro-adherence factor A-like n=1 Tax=Cololabis saira TaxID=129043 RepID=UPI002AD48921|nr:uro-adherence factor A-like [Cololabis saira]
MENGTVLSVMFLTLSWAFMGAYAQTTMTTASQSMTHANMTTASESMTHANMTTASQSVTHANMTTASESMTHANMTTTSESMTHANMTTTSESMTHGNMTTASESMTHANMTTASETTHANMTTASETTHANMTTASETTHANMTTASENMTHANMTTASENMTHANMTTASENMTHANMTTASENMTHANMTTASENMTHANMTTASGTTHGNMTTASESMTHANMTTASENMTHANMTTASETTHANMTTAATAAPPVSPNNTVVPLETTISRTGCGSQQLCAGEPVQCDPSTSPGSCFFLGARQISGRNFEFGLAGESEGYISASLATGSTTGVNVTTYVCANNGGTVRFFGALLNNDNLVKTTLPANSVKGSVNGTQIQCTFVATVPDATTRTENRFSLSVATGAYNRTSEELGSPTPKIRTAQVDLAKPNTTVANQLSSPSLPPSRTGCGSDKLCASEPSDCDPSASGSCLFFSSKNESGQTFKFELSGQSSGFLAASLSNDTKLGGNDTTYVCANNNGSFLFVSGIFNNGSFTKDSRNITNSGIINGSTIHCTFTAEESDSSVAARVTARAVFRSIILSNGTFNASDQTVGEFLVQFRSSIVDLANPNATVTNLENTSTNHAVTHQQSLLQVLLSTVGVLVLTMGGRN